MENKLRKLIKEAMIEKRNTGNSNKYQTYKNILEKAQKIAKDERTEEIKDEFIINATKKEIKQIEDLLIYCTEGSDKSNELKECIKYAKEILPQTTTEEEIKEFLIKENIEKNMGICMKALKSKFGNNLDGKVASALVKEYIK